MWIMAGGLLLEPRQEEGGLYEGDAVEKDRNEWALPDGREKIKLID